MISRKDPSLDEILDDPIVHAMMARDGITREYVETLMETVSRRLGDRRRAHERQRERLAA